MGVSCRNPTRQAFLKRRDASRASIAFDCPAMSSQVPKLCSPEDHRLSRLTGSLLSSDSGSISPDIRPTVVPARCSKLAGSSTGGPNVDVIPFSDPRKAPVGCPPPALWRFSPPPGGSRGHAAGGPGPRGGHPAGGGRGRRILFHRHRPSTGAERAVEG